MEVPETATRRNVLLSTGTLLAGGSAVAFVGSEQSKAQVSADSLNIPNSEHSSKSGSVEDVTLSVTGDYNFEVEAATDFNLSLWVASEGGNDYQRLDRNENEAMASGMGATYSLSGSMFDHDDLGKEQFTAGPEETITRNIPVRVELEVFNNGESVTTATAETSATLEVTNTTIKATGSVSGDGSVEFTTPT